MKTSLQVINESISEKEFMDVVIQAAELLGWKVSHTWLSIHSPSGYPDLTLARENNEDGSASLIFLELKKQSGKLTQEQAAWLELLSRVQGVVAKCVRPSDWLEIEKLLE